MFKNYNRNENIINSSLDLKGKILINNVTFKYNHNEQSLQKNDNICVTLKKKMCWQNFIYDNNDEIHGKLEGAISDFVKSGFVEIINYRERQKIQMIALVIAINKTTITVIDLFFMIWMNLLIYTIIKIL